MTGENHLFERQVTSDEVRMIKDFLVALYPYASDDFKVWLLKAYSILYEEKTIREISEDLQR